MEASVEAFVEDTSKEAFVEVTSMGDFVEVTSMEASVEAFVEATFMEAFAKAFVEACGFCFAWKLSSMKAFMEPSTASIASMEASMEAVGASAEDFMSFHAKIKKCRRPVY